jgi:hypothetical protein
MRQAITLLESNKERRAGMGVTPLEGKARSARDQPRHMPQIRRTVNWIKL